MSIPQPTKLEKEKQRLLQEKCQSLLNEMLRDEDNKYCVDCDAKGPRWASWNLGIFLCIRCAGIHRNLGVHISRVKSVNLDTWKPDQVVTMQQMGNSRARAVYEASLPDNHRRPQTDVALENFIRAKYEQKKYIAQEWVQPRIPAVNWDNEIEESIKKKKEVKKIYNTLPTTVPIPKPKAVVVVENKIPSTLVDIPRELPVQEIPVQISEDPFGLSGLDLSSGSNDLAQINISQDIIQTQTINNSNSNKKMTKESIMSLYGNSTVASVSQQTMQNPFGTPMYGQQQQQVGVGNPFPQNYSTMQHQQQHQPQFFGNQQQQITPSGNLMYNIQSDISQLGNLSSLHSIGTQNIYSTGQPGFIGNPSSTQQRTMGIGMGMGTQGFHNSNSYRPNQTPAPAAGPFSGFGLG